jgi:hypothetical protein
MGLSMLEQFLSDPSKIGAVGLMAVAIAALMRGWVVTSHHMNQVVQQYEQRITKLESEKDEFKRLVITSVETTDRAIRVAEKKTEK